MSKSDIELGAREVCVSNCFQEESHKETTAVPQHSGEVLDGVYSGRGERLRLQSGAKCSKAVMIFERGSQEKNQYLLQPYTSQVLCLAFPGGVHDVCRGYEATAAQPDIPASSLM